MVNEIASRLFAQVDKKGKEMARIHKALKSLASEETLNSPRKVREACRLLEQSDPKAFGLDMDFSQLLESVAADQENRLKARRLEFGRMLKENAGASGLACTMINTDPMEFAISPFTVVVDLDQNLARINYARLRLEELQARPDRIIAAMEKNLKVLEGGWSMEEFFDALYQAYQTELFERGRSRGERVALTGLLGRVALAFQGERFRADPVAANYRAYGRARLAYDLFRLRRGGLLQRNGLRLNLGPATGSSTRNKKGVLYVEDGPGQGQYYLSIWFSPVE